MSDLVRPDLGELDWSPGRREASLATVYAHAVGLAQDAEAWYASKRPEKKRWGRALRIVALLLASAGAILPILAEIFTTDGKPQIAPGWAAVALAAAATLVTLDRYFGFSNSWMRFMAAELRISQLRHQFQYAWNAARVKLSDPPTEEELAPLLELARTLVDRLDQAILDETDRWVTEFRGGLEQTERGLGSPGGA
jgi:hypothetical protein